MKGEVLIMPKKKPAPSFLRNLWTTAIANPRTTTAAIAGVTLLVGGNHIDDKEITRITEVVGTLLVLFGGAAALDPKSTPPPSPPTGE